MSTVTCCFFVVLFRNQATRLGQLPKPYGWHSYFSWRFSDAEGDQVAIEPALVDGVSYPLTFVYALQLLHAVLPDLFKRLGNARTHC